MQDAVADRRVGLGELFLGFLGIGLMGFGGVGPIARHVIVERRRWLDDRGYATVLGLGKVLPGPNTVNAAVIIGDRFQGVAGSLAAVAGLMAMPLAILVGLATLYGEFGGVPEVRVAVAGAAAAAAGLVIGMASKLAKGLRTGRSGLVAGLLALLAVAGLHQPLALVVAVLGPLAVVGSWVERRR